MHTNPNRKAGRAVAAIVTALALAGPGLAAATPAAAETGEQASTLAAPYVQVFKADGVPSIKIAHAITHQARGERADFTQLAVRAAANADGKPYNVIIMNLSQNYEEHLTGVHFYANVTFNSVFYGIWIAEGGTFKNLGDGGYRNWAFIGQFTRSGDGGKVVHFK